jgi:hypothetical protein
VEEGLLTLRRVGVLNAARGVTSVEEVLRITLDDESGKTHPRTSHPA